MNLAADQSVSGTFHAADSRKKIAAFLFNLFIFITVIIIIIIIFYLKMRSISFGCPDNPS